jgi:hypothetical protein
MGTVLGISLNDKQAMNLVSYIISERSKINKILVILKK